MNIESACHIILGDELAHAIISSQGVHWAVVAAMAHAKQGDNHQALQAIRDYLDQEKEAQ